MKRDPISQSPAKNPLLDGVIMDESNKRSDTQQHKIMCSI